MSKLKTLLFRRTLLGRMRREIVELSSISKQGGELRSYTATHLLSFRAPVCWVLQVVQGNVSVLTPALSGEAAVNAVKVTATTSWFSLTRESERGWGVTTRCSQPAAVFNPSMKASTMYNIDPWGVCSQDPPSIHILLFLDWYSTLLREHRCCTWWLGLCAWDSSMQRVGSGQIWSSGYVCNSCQADGAENSTGHWSQDPVRPGGGGAAHIRGWGQCLPEENTFSPELGRFPWIFGFSHIPPGFSWLGNARV